MPDTCVPRSPPLQTLMKSSESGREAGFLKMGVKLWNYWVMLCYPAGKKKKIKTLVHRKEVEGGGCVCVCLSSSPQRYIKL